MSRLGPDRAKKLWQVGGNLHGRFFQMRQRYRYFGFDSGGYWPFPALVATESGEIQWLHVMFPLEASGRRFKVFPPSVIAVTPQNSCLLLRYEDFGRPGVTDFKYVGVYPWPGIANMTVAEYENIEMSLACMYAPAAEIFRLERTVPFEFQQLYRKVTPRRILGFMRRYAPDFVAAVTAA